MWITPLIVRKPNATRRLWPATQCTMSIAGLRVPQYRQVRLLNVDRVRELRRQAIVLETLADDRPKFWW